MTRWMLAGAAALAIAAPTWADDEPKKENPFLPGNRPARNTDKPAKPDAKEKEKDKEANQAEVNAARVAHIKLAGDLDESPVPAESLFGPTPENLKSKLDRIRKAAKDEKIKALWLDLGDGEEGLEVGFGRLHEIRAAIAEFRAGGKKAFASAESLDGKQLLIGLACDRLMIPESGAVTVYGLRAEVGYYKKMLEKLSLKADVLKMGAYKSAVEPFLSDKMSAENREQLEALLGDQYDNELVAGIVRGRPERGWTAEQVKGVIDQGPFTAKKARDLGLVDALAYPDELEAAMAQALGAPEVRVLKDYGKPKTAELDLSNPFALFAAIGGGKKKSDSKEPKIAVIYAVGAISSGKGGDSPFSGGERVGSETIIEAVKKAEKDATVKAIVLRIDSPGGSALASDMMWRELARCKKPLVASMGDTAASGGYYIAMAAKRIYAEPGTITGSIGVFGLKLVTGGLEEWAGVSTEVVARGKNSGVNSTTFPWTESEKAALMAYVEETYSQFLDKALVGRKQAKSKIGSRDELQKLAGGRVWTGRQALGNGLVDELGTLKDAIAGAQQLAGIDPKQEMELLILPKAQTFFDKLLDGEGKLPFSSSAVLGQLKLIPGGQKALELVGPLLKMQNDPIKALMPMRIEWK